MEEKWWTGAAGVGEGDLLGVLLVARRGSGEVEVWRWVENELGGSVYSRSKAVAENGITSAMITVGRRETSGAAAAERKQGWHGARPW